MSRNLGIAGIQMNVVRGADNSDAMIQKLDTVANCFPWVELIFFSELCICGMDTAMAAPLPNAALDRVIAWARKEQKWIIPGSLYEKGEKGLYNTSVVISPDGGIAAKYRKIFPWKPLEASIPGNEFCVFDIPGKGSLGLCICYDQWFPEVARTLSWMGAEAIICISATYTSDRPQELIIAQAHAIMNQVYWLNLNGTGDGGLGNSIFVDPNGRILQNPGEGECIMTEVIDFDLTSRVREYGTLGLSQVWKDLVGFPGSFPVYQGDMKKGPLFSNLGPQVLHKKIDGKG